MISIFVYNKKNIQQRNSKETAKKQSITMSEILVCVLFIFYMIKYTLEFLKTNDIMVLNIIDRFMSIHKEHNRMEILDNNYIRY